MQIENAESQERYDAQQWPSVYFCSYDEHRIEGRMVANVGSQLDGRRRQRAGRTDGVAKEGRDRVRQDERENCDWHEMAMR